jgi:uncharacterized protein YecT (DUF1311 family)
MVPLTAELASGTIISSATSAWYLRPKGPTVRAMIASYSFARRTVGPSRQTGIGRAPRQRTVIVAMVVLLGATLITQLAWYETAFAKGPAAYNANCSKGNTDLQIDTCLGQAVSAGNVLLSSIVSTLERKIPDRVERNDLSISITAWKKYVVAECIVESHPFTGGTIYPIIYSSCQQTLTIAEIKTLRSDSKLLFP